MGRSLSFDDVKDEAVPWFLSGFFGSDQLHGIKVSDNLQGKVFVVGLPLQLSLLRGSQRAVVDGFAPKGSAPGESNDLGGGLLGKFKFPEGFQFG
ncbi:MAG: hypothetical protein HC841_09410 [Verrucomicrobiae bacterium]|nr:hypothetical protein [Verrucomicrobiae bacterium]